jgi:hypothetical protein
MWKPVDIDAMMTAAGFRRVTTPAQSEWRKELARGRVMTISTGPERCAYGDPDYRHWLLEDRVENHHVDGAIGMTLDEALRCAEAYAIGW